MAKMAEVKLIALRAQMNPHFIFNCINTSQNFIMNSEHYVDISFRQNHKVGKDFATGC